MISSETGETVSANSVRTGCQSYAFCLALREKCESKELSFLPIRPLTHPTPCVNINRDGHEFVSLNVSLSIVNYFALCHSSSPLAGLGLVLQGLFELEVYY